MNVQDELARISLQSPTALTIGVFDGVHKGHQYLLQRLRDAATRNNYQTVVVTFMNHPRTVLSHGFGVSYITTITERIKMLRACGADHVVPITFTHELSLLTPRTFVRLLCRFLQMKNMVVGPDFALGRNRRGAVPVLHKLGQEMGFIVETIELLRKNEYVVSSTSIREALSHGNIEAVMGYLGRPFRLVGPVERGSGRGKNIGFPTINVRVMPEQLLPPDGVYATWVFADNRWCRSATNIGVRPTFGDGKRVVESFIMDFEGDLYDQNIILDFAGRLRGEEKFPNIDALTDQMNQDVEHAHHVLQSVKPGQIWG